MKRVLVLRPEPGNAHTVARLAALGLPAIPLPLFEVVPVPWQAPGPGGYDALLLTSANAVRHGGTGLRALATLPVAAVGTETARAAEKAGLAVALTGERDAAAAVAQAHDAGFARLLHLCGRDHVATDATAIVVYASVPRAAALPPLDRAIALLHSRRAAEAFAALIPASDRSRVSLVAISPAALGGAGKGWAHAEAAPEPTDAAMAALTLRLARD